MVAATLLWPGPGVAPELVPGATTATPRQPPVDTTGSATRQLVATGQAGTTTVFWEEPEPGKVHLVIEVSPSDGAAGEGGAAGGVEPAGDD